MKPIHLLRASLFAAAAFAATGGQAAEISGAGATFPYPIYAKWAEAYKKETGDSLNYQSIGSGGGIKQIKAGTVTFGASDQPLMVKELDAAGLAQWPMVMGAIVPVVNLEGVKPGELTLDGPTLAAIYMGKIKRWDDAALKKLNPDVKLPSTAIAVAYRSDGSGTTFNFTNYLSKVSPEFKSSIGENASVEWPAGVGAKGNEGVAATVGQTKGAIGYVEYAYAKQNGMTTADMMNKDGEKVAPEMASFQAAASNADWANAPGYYQILTDQPGAQSWPIDGRDLHPDAQGSQRQDAAAATRPLKFFDWAYAKGGDMARRARLHPHARQCRGHGQEDLGRRRQDPLNCTKGGRWPSAVARLQRCRGTSL